MTPPEQRVAGLELKRVLHEALLVAAIGLVFAVVANGLSFRGLSLTRNYFPETHRAAGGPAGKGSANAGVATRETNRADNAIQATAITRLKEKGLQPIDANEVARLFRDPQYEQELIVFIDARDDRHYQEGHIPGAYQFDRYYPEKHLSTVLPACLNATKIVVYCAGGNCEDSEFAAAALKDAGVSPERLFVYAGGMTEWAGNGSPIERGGRKSGNLGEAKP